MMHVSVPVILEITITVIATLGVILQTIALVGMYLTIKGAVEHFHEVSRIAKEHAIPAVETVHHLFSDIYPDLKRTVENCIQVCKILRETSGILTAAAKNFATPIKRLLKTDSDTTSAIWSPPRSVVRPTRDRP